MTTNNYAIFKSTNTVTQEYYIGFRDVKKLYDMRRYFGNSEKILESVRIHGKKNFIRDILQYCTTIEEAKNNQKYYIDFEDSKCLNFYTKPINTKSFLGKKHTEKTKAKMSAVAKTIDKTGEKNIMFDSKWMYNPITKQAVPISKDNQQEHLNNGWLYGRKEPSTKKKIQRKIVNTSTSKIQKIKSAKLKRSQIIFDRFGFKTLSIPKLVSNVFNFDLEQKEAPILVKEGIATLIREYENGSTSNEIKEKYNIKLANLTDWLKNVGANIRTISQSNKLYHGTLNEDWTETFKIYRRNCEFKFKFDEQHKVENIELLKEHKVYNPKTNKNGWVKDHMFSVWDGWKHPEGPIDPSIISHLANCRIMLQQENALKHTDSSISLEELKQRIKDWDNNIDTTIKEDHL